MGGSGISWTTCKSFAPHSRQITMPVPISRFFTGRMLFLTPNQHLPRGQTTQFLWKQTWSAIKGCYISLDSLDHQQQLLGGQPFQQATVTLKFKMASNMATMFLNIGIVINCYFIFTCNASFLWFSRSRNLFMMVSEWFDVIYIICLINLVGWMYKSGQSVAILTMCCVLIV